MKFEEKQLDPASLIPGDKLYEPKLIVDCKNRLGECTVWDDRTGCFMWCDIDGLLIQILHLETGKLKTVTLPERVGAFAMCESGKRLLVAMETTFAYYYDETTTLEYVKSSYKQ